MAEQQTSTKHARTDTSRRHDHNEHQLTRHSRRGHNEKAVAHLPAQQLVDGRFDVASGQGQRQPARRAVEAAISEAPSE